MTDTGAAETPTSTLGKALTVAVHAAIVAVHLVLLEQESMGIIAVNVCAAHYALLQGLWGPKKHALWWVPSPHYEPISTMVFCILGVVHFLGIAIISYNSLERTDCPSDVTSRWYLLRSLPPDTPVGSAVDGMVSYHGCTTSESGALVGACDACGTCEPCAVAAVKEWADALADDSTPVGEALNQSLAMARCVEVTGFDVLVVHWTFVDTLWFSVVLLTTVGYGNTFTPSNPQSRAFTLLWSLYGLFIFGSSTVVVSDALAALHERSASRTRKVLKSIKAPSLKAPSPASQPVAAAERPPGIYYVGRGLYFNFVYFVALNLGGSAILVGLEDGWTMLDGFYHCMMTATTIGLGDIAPQTQAGRVYGIVHMILSVVLFGNILGTILSGLSMRNQARAQRASPHLHPHPHPHPHPHL